MDYKIAVHNYILKKRAEDKEDAGLQQLTKDLDFALSKTGMKEAGVFQNILVGVALASALFNSASAEANAAQMHKALKSLDGAGNGIVKVHSNLSGDRGRYTIDVGPYEFEGDYSSLGKGKVKQVKHTLKITLESKADPDKVKQYKPVVEKLQSLLKTHGTSVLEK